MSLFILQTVQKFAEATGNALTYYKLCVFSQIYNTYIPIAMGKKKVQFWSEEGVKIKEK